MALTKEERKRLAALAASIGIARHFGDRMTMEALHVFLEIGQQPGLTMREISETTGLALASVSRNLYSLGQRHRDGTPGFDLIITQRDSNEGRRFQAFLTSRGERYARLLTSH
jgi:DNA-binding MarR family transcriptional regulator